MGLLICRQDVRKRRPITCEGDDPGQQWSRYRRPLASRSHYRKCAVRATAADPQTRPLDLSDERCEQRFTSQVLRSRHPVGEGSAEAVQDWLPPGDPPSLAGAFGV